jgi:small subunit ribosomal protein S4e
MHTKRVAVGYGKEHKWVVTPRPGPHPKRESIPLLLVLRDILRYADTIREARFIINKGSILVDKKVRKDPKFGVGLMDLIEIPKMKKYFRVMPSKKGLILKEIDKKESNIKLCKIMNKTIVKQGNIQLNFHDGSNILLKKEEGDKWKTRETVVLELPERKIKEKVEFSKGNLALIVEGRHAGETGKIAEIVEGTQTRKTLIKIDDIETLADYVLMVGKNKPLISM